METIGSYEAKTHWSALTQRVAAGQEITITRRGVPIARLVPENGNEDEVKRAVSSLKAIREHITLGEIDWKELRDEGRR